MISSVGTSFGSPYVILICRGEWLNTDRILGQRSTGGILWSKTPLCSCIFSAEVGTISPTSTDQTKPRTIFSDQEIRDRLKI